MGDAGTIILEKDVDAKSGNIEHSADVIVKGSVRSGLAVISKGTITIEENVEDASIDAGFNVIIRKEFGGTGKGTVSAKGTVEIGTIVGQKVSCSGNVTITDKAIDCAILSKGTIRVLGAAPGSLRGGTLCARKGVAVASAGDEKGVKTVIEAGDREAFAQASAAQIKLHAVNKEKNVVENQLNELNRLRKINNAKYSSQISTMEHLMEQLTELTTKTSELTKTITDNRAFCAASASANIVVSGDIYPGVVININDASYTVARKFSKCVFLYDRGKILIKGIR